MFHVKTNQNSQWILQKKKSLQKTQIHPERHWIHIEIFAAGHATSPPPYNCDTHWAHKRWEKVWPKKCLDAVPREVNKQTEKLKWRFQGMKDLAKEKSTRIFCIRKQ